MPARSGSHEDDTPLLSDNPSDDARPLTAKERALFLESLKAAERRIQEGQFVVYDEATFKERLIRVFRLKKHAPGA